MLGWGTDVDTGLRCVGVLLADEIPPRALAGDVPAALGEGVADQDLRVAGMGDVLDDVFFIVEIALVI